MAAKYFEETLEEFRCHDCLLTGVIVIASAHESIRHSVRIRPFPGL